VKRIGSLLVLCLVVAAPAAHASTSLVTEGFVNAPVAEVWRIFTTSEELPKLGVAQGQVDLRLGGQIRTHTDPKGMLGDAETSIYEILAYEPERMLAVRLQRAPASFPHRDALERLWTVLYFTPSGADMTHVRIVALGLDDEPRWNAARAYFERHHRWTLDHLAKQYWPQCARCALEEAEEEMEP